MSQIASTPESDTPPARRKAARSLKPRKKARAPFRRETPEDRARQLGEATLRCIQKRGAAGISARQIAAEAGVTQGLVTHHFGEVGELVAFSFDLMSDTIFQAVEAAVEAAGPDPLARLDAYVAASFSPAIFDRDVLAVWVVFWGLILHSPRMAEAQQREYGGYLAKAEVLIGDLAAVERFPLPQPRLAAVAFTALLDGLWLAWCLNPAAFDPEDGIRLCRNWIEGMRRGAQG